MKTKYKTYHFPCCCAFGHQHCGFLRVVVGDETIELCWVKNRKEKNAKIGVYLDEKSSKKFKKLL